MLKNVCLTLMLIPALLSASCTQGGEAEVPEDMVQAVRAIQDMTRPFNLKRSMFAAAYGTSGKPSDFVSYMFSDMGVAEWPPVEGGMEMDEISPEPAGAIGQTVLPAGVAIIPLKPNPEIKKQVVVGFDDNAGEVILTAYTDPAAAPVLEQRVPFTAVPGNPMAKEFFESNRQTGMSYRSF